MIQPNRAVARCMRWRAAMAACAAGLACGCAHGPAARGAADGGRVAALEQATAAGPRACASTAGPAAERQRAMWRTCGPAAQGSRHACVRALMFACG